ncbi:MAG: N-carbamoyl-D-amino-acid hydrolase [Planctomycetaceae bacterium]|nr:N-carbamoyl-D-amino-acid hydrolase [Planctomycetaceae bacterium]
MPRYLTVGAAQSGPIPLHASRRDAVARLIHLLREAAERGCDLVVFTECALTPFFPHWYLSDSQQLDSYFETEMPSDETRPLFDEAARLGIGFHLGFAELAHEGGATRHYNTAILVSPSGQIVGKFRKIHLPGYREPRSEHPFQNLEKRYFDVGDIGFQTWRMLDGVMGICICNDRRWPESFRALALRGAELVMVGYNTPLANPDHPQMDHLVSFHHQLCLQAAAYQNGMWIVGVAKAGEEEGVRQLGGTSIVAPSGEVVALAQTIEDELVVHRCNLDDVLPYKNGIFNFAANRQIRHYQVITDQTAATAPAADGEETSS